MRILKLCLCLTCTRIQMLCSPFWVLKVLWAPVAPFRWHFSQIGLVQINSAGQNTLDSVESGSCLRVGDGMEQSTEPPPRHHLVIHPRWLYVMFKWSTKRSCLGNWFSEPCWRKIARKRFFEEMCFFAISQSIFKILVSIFQVMGILDFLRKIFLSIGLFCLKKMAYTSALSTIRFCP